MSAEPEPDNLEDSIRTIYGSLVLRHYRQFAREQDHETALRWACEQAAHDIGTERRRLARETGRPVFFEDGAFWHKTKVADLPEHLR
jgi:hypothetical protein